jgi:hypothetical protein
MVNWDLKPEMTAFLNINLEKLMLLKAPKGCNEEGGPKAACISC